MSHLNPNRDDPNTREPGLVHGRIPEAKYTLGKSTFYVQSPQESKTDGEPSLKQPEEETSGPGTRSTPIVYSAKASSLSSYASSVTSQDIGSMQRKLRQYSASKTTSFYSMDTVEIRIVVTGEKLSGKTQLIGRAAGESFSCQHDTGSAANAKAHTKAVYYRDNMYIVDLSELPEDALTKEEHDVKQYFSGVMAAFVVYDMSKEESLSATVEWKKRINNSVCMMSGDPIPVYLLGNKCDTEGPHYDGSSIAAAHGFTGYFTTSAKTNKGIDDAVEQAVREVLKESYPHLPKTCETPDHLKTQ